MRCLRVKYSKSFRRTVVNNCTCNCDVQNSYFLKRAVLFGVLVTLKFLRSTVVSGNSCFKRIYLKHHVIVKKADCFQNTTTSRPFFKVVCVISFIERSCDRSFIFFLSVVAFLRGAV